jgi:hypothetical protein
VADVVGLGGAVVGLSEILPALCHLPVLLVYAIALLYMERLCEDLEFMLLCLTHFEPGTELLIPPSLYKQLRKRQDRQLLRLRGQARSWVTILKRGDVKFRVYRILSQDSNYLISSCHVRRD